MLVYNVSHHKIKIKIMKAFPAGRKTFREKIMKRLLGLSSINSEFTIPPCQLDCKRENE
jgi:hypothetical protein